MENLLVVSMKKKNQKICNKNLYIQT